MGIEINETIAGFEGPVADARYRIETTAGATVSVGVHDVGVDGVFKFDMAGKGQPLGTSLSLHVDDFSGANQATAKACYGWAVVKDDGVAPATILKLLPIGDSWTDRGSTNSFTGIRPTDQSCAINMNGSFVTAAYIQSANDYLFRDDMGKSGDTTAGLLTRLPDVLARDSDLILLLIGINDSDGVIATSKANYTQIVIDLTQAGKQVLICQCPYRNDIADPTARNAFVDELNAHCVTLAATYNGVEITAVPTLFNAAMMSDQVTFGGVSNDGLHANGYGNMMYSAETITPVLNSLFPSTFEDKSSALPAVFSGTGGVLSNGATGATPDGWRGYYSSPQTGVGYALSNIDGDDWQVIRTNGGVPVSSNNKSKFSNVPDPAAVTDGWWVLEARVVVETPDVLSSINMYVESTGVTYGRASISKTNEADGAFVAGEEFLLRTPTCRLDDGFALTVFETEQVQGVDCEVRIVDMKLYKVEDI